MVLRATNIISTNLILNFNTKPNTQQDNSNLCTSLQYVIRNTPVKMFQERVKMLTD